MELSREVEHYLSVSSRMGDAMSAGIVLYVG